MAREKGCKKLGGRTKGTPNKRTSFINSFCEYITDGGGEKFKEELNKLSGKDYVNAFIELSKFSVGDNVTIQANKYIIEALTNKTK